MTAQTNTPDLSVDELRQRIAQLPWFHTMELAPGILTPGTYDPRRTLARLKLPGRLDGIRALDVGAWDGFYAFELERRGADVLATDSFSWDGGDLGSWGSKASFELAREALGSKVRDQWIDAMDLHPDAVGGTYDVVLCLGVLYHMRNPLGLLERVRSVTGAGGLLVLETEVGMLLTRRAAAEFFPSRELNNDPTNWWAPNIPAVVGMLRAAGFDDVEVVWRRRLPWRLARLGYHTCRFRRLSFMRSLTGGRAVFHARVGR